MSSKLRYAFSQKNLKTQPSPSNQRISMKTWYIQYLPNGRRICKSLLEIKADKEPSLKEARKLAATRERLKPTDISGVEVSDRWPYGWD